MIPKPGANEKSLMQTLKFTPLILCCLSATIVAPCRSEGRVCSEFFQLDDVSALGSAESGASSEELWLRITLEVFEKTNRTYGLVIVRTEVRRDSRGEFLYAQLRVQPPEGFEWETVVQGRRVRFFYDDVPRGPRSQPPRSAESI